MNMSAMQLEYLKELVNIAIGSATASVASLLNAFATMNIPEVSVITIKIFMNDSKVNTENEKIYISKQIFNGLFGGEALFILNQNSATNLCKHLYSSEEVMDDEKIDAISELQNIINSTIIGRLTEELDTQVQFSVPTTKYEYLNNILDSSTVFDTKYVISIKTVMHFKEKDIHGKIILLIKDSSMLKLQKLIDKRLEELFI